jgi:hypothetical protein
VNSGLKITTKAISGVNDMFDKYSDQASLMAYLIIGLFVGTIAFFDGIRRYKQKKMVENTPTSKIRSVAKGLAELRGVAEVNESLLEAPLTGKACVYYRYKISYLDSDDNKRLLDEGRSYKYFYLKDETGKILVEHCLAEMYIGDPRQILRTSRYGQRIPDRIMNYMEKKGLQIFKKMVFEEWYICPGEEFYILGTVNPKKNGDQNEYIVTRGEEEKTFIISNSSEEGSVNHLSYLATVEIYLGPVIAAFCAYFLVLLFQGKL